jgi:hypothetical protein
MLALTLAVVLIPGSVNSHSRRSPVGGQSIGILDVDVEHAGHVVLRFIPRPRRVILCKVHRQVPEMGKGISLVVELGPEAKSLVVLHRTRNIDDPKDRFVANDLNRTTQPFDLKSALAVHPVDAVVTDSDIRGRPQSDEAASERFFTVRTHENF